VAVWNRRGKRRHESEFCGVVVSNCEMLRACAWTPAGASRAEYRAKVEQLRRQNQSLAVHPAEERASREEI